MEVGEVLRRTGLFSGLTDPEIEQIRTIGVTKTYPKGVQIFSEGEKATGFYVNLSGQVKIYKVSPDGREQILHIIAPAEGFAEAALFTGSTYPAFAEPLSKTTLMYFPKERFLRLIQENPQLSLNMIAGLSALLRRFVDLVEALSFRDVASRVARYVLDASTQSGLESSEGTMVELDVSKTQLASKLGTISETLSRALRKLQDRKILRVSGKQITILDKETLEDIASGIEA